MNMVLNTCTLLGSQGINVIFASSLRICLRRKANLSDSTSRRANVLLQIALPYAKQDASGCLYQRATWPPLYPSFVHSLPTLVFLPQQLKFCQHEVQLDIRSARDVLFVRNMGGLRGWS
jgi:hypothetical protein